MVAPFPPSNHIRAKCGCGFSIRNRVITENLLEAGMSTPRKERSSLTKTIRTILRLSELKLLLCHRQAESKDKKEKLKYALEHLEIGPLDSLNADLLDQVHPVKWKDPDGIPVYNIIAIGAGAGGLVTCGSTSRAGGKAALIEDKMMGGDCLNVGCVPSKALLSAAKCAYKCRTASSWGVNVKEVSCDFAKIMERMREIRNAGIMMLGDTSEERLRPIGCELGQAFVRFGSQVKIFSRRGIVMSKEDPEAAAIVKQQMEKEGVEFIAATTEKCEVRDSKILMTYKTKEGKVVEELFDELLLSAGRVPNIEGLNLEAAGVQYTQKGVTVNDHLQTSNPDIYATGTSAVLVTDNALKGMNRKYSDFVIPRVTFTEPEVAHVGLTEPEIKNKFGEEYYMFKRPFKIVDRNITDGYKEGFCKMFTMKKTDEILGCTIVGHDKRCMMISPNQMPNVVHKVVHVRFLASLQKVTTAMVGKLGALTVAKIICPYPTMHENVKFTAAGFRGKLKNMKPYYERKLKAEREGTTTCANPVMKLSIIAFCGLALAAATYRFFAKKTK
eukprot:jgi/Bigna1/90609/estExt_fgenesh1_pg.C_740067